MEDVADSVGGDLGDEHGLAVIDAPSLGFEVDQLGQLRGTLGGQVVFSQKVRRLVATDASVLGRLDANLAAEFVEISPAGGHTTIVHLFDDLGKQFARKAASMRSNC